MSWEGCPNCGCKQYRNQFIQTDHHGYPLYDRRGRPKTECRYTPDDGSLNWERQLYKCKRCGNIYDRRDGFSNWK